MKHAALVIGLLLAACRSPEPAYFTLIPVRGPAQPGAPGLVELRRPSIPGYLDRSEIVRAGTPYRLRVAQGERWGEPFGDMVSRVLAEDLNLRLPGTTVFSASGAISADAGATVEVDVQRFDADAAGRVQLSAEVAVTQGRNRAGAVARHVRATVAPAGSSTQDLVAAMSQALGEAADQIASVLRAR